MFISRLSYTPALQLLVFPLTVTKMKLKIFINIEVIRGQKKKMQTHIQPHPHSTSGKQRRQSLHIT